MVNSIKTDVEAQSQKAPLLVKVCRGEAVPRPPVWLMRQAGRYLPEYLAIRAKHSMLDAIRTPELAVEITLQPIRRFGMDAAIVFADILNPLIGLGFPLEFEENRGPVFQRKIESPADVENLVVPPPEENVGYTLAALRTLKQELHGQDRALIGFAGAPFTLSYYLIEGAGKSELVRTKEFMYKHPASWHKLQEALVTLVADYLVAQAQAGADVVQIFDSWAWALSPSCYAANVFPYLQEIITRVRSKVATSIVYFAPAGMGLYDQIANLGVDMVGIDWRITLPEANKRLGGVLPLQGNLDPAALFTPLPHLEEQVRRILEEGAKVTGHSMNLGHGVLPKTPVEAVGRVVEMVKAFSYSASS